MRIAEFSNGAESQIRNVHVPVHLRHSVISELRPTNLRQCACDLLDLPEVLVSAFAIRMLSMNAGFELPKLGEMCGVVKL